MATVAPGRPGLPSAHGTGRPGPREGRKDARGARLAAPPGNGWRRRRVPPVYAAAPRRSAARGSRIRTREGCGTRRRACGGTEARRAGAEAKGAAGARSVERPFRVHATPRRASAGPGCLVSFPRRRTGSPPRQGLEEDEAGRGPRVTAT